MPKKKDTKKLVLLDAHAILHRAYHALPDFTSSNGEPTGALYGMVAMLLKIVKDLEPDYIAACYDLPKPTYRHEIYKEYKAGRAETDVELSDQIERSRDVLDAFNIPIYENEGFEADDVLGTIVEQLKGKDIDVVIASGDMDTLQLVDGNRVKVYTLKKGINDTIIYNEKSVNERFGFGPEKLPDYKGLMGDPSDNIIGVKGIGQKTATTLIVNFDSIENIAKLLKKGDEAFLKAGIKQRIIGLLRDQGEEAEFSKMLALIRRDVPIKYKIPEVSWKSSVDTQKLINLFKELSFRTLTERVRVLFDIKESEPEEEPVKSEISESKREELLVAFWVLDSENTNPSMDDVLEHENTRSESEAYESVFKKLKKEKIDHIYFDIEKPIIPVIKKMKKRGILIDKKYLLEISKKYHKELNIISADIFKMAGGEFNMNSPKQLSEVLYDKLNLRSLGQRKTPGGQRSTRESELQKLLGKHPIIEEILKYRELQKLLSTYIDTIPKMVEKDGRLRADFLQTGAATGRMSSQNPNLQNIPIRTERGRKIRDAFLAENGYSLVSFDYSQIELRIAAFLSGDEKMIDTFKRGEDIHRTVASEVFGIPMNEVTPGMRRQAKVVNFGILYGMGANALSKTADMSRAEAQKFLREYTFRFKGLADYLISVKGKTRKNGFTETYFGRRRYLPGISSQLPYVRAEAERMAINAPIQGTNADIVKIAMARVDKWLKKEGLEEEVHLILQVHDELVYEIDKKVLDVATPNIKEIMESVLGPEDTKGIPLAIDVSVGDNYGSLASLER